MDIRTGRRAAALPKEDQTATRRRLTLLIDEVPHIIETAADAAFLDGKQLVNLLGREGTKTVLPSGHPCYVYSTSSHPNLASDWMLTALADTFIARMFLGMPLAAHYTINWFHLSSGEPANNIQTLPWRKKDVNEFDFHAAIVAATPPLPASAPSV